MMTGKRLTRIHNVARQLINRMDRAEAETKRAWNCISHRDDIMGIDNWENHLETYKQARTRAEYWASRHPEAVAFAVAIA